MSPLDFLKELESSLAEYRFSDISKLVQKLDPDKFSTDEAKKVLSLLRRKRLFSEMEKVAGLFTLSGMSAPIIRRLYVQSLIDQNRLSQGLSVLETMTTILDDDENERAEVYGLKGRIFKQLYINEGDKNNLRNAIGAYAPFWLNRLGDYRWHGINMVALLHRAKVDCVDTGISVDYHEIAADILAEIDSLGESAQVWDFATATEAAIALERMDEALKWASKYVLDEKTDAFELASTLRQFKEVWLLERSQIGKMLLPAMECALLHLEGGTVQLTQTEKVKTEGFQAIFGNQSAVFIKWMDTMLHWCRSVARVRHKLTGEPFGTGFMMNGVDLSHDLDGVPVFVTNAHVVSNNPVDMAPLIPEDTSVEFTRLPGMPIFELGDMVFSSPKFELDVSVFLIKYAEETSPLTIAKYLPLVPKDGDAPQRIYVVGHPNGGDMAVTLYDNNLVGFIDERYAHYRSPTEGGHSGSPVFTREWKLFAIHHRAIEDKQVNEGVLMQAIRCKISHNRASKNGVKS